MDPELYRAGHFAELLIGGSDADEAVAKIAVDGGGRLAITNAAGDIPMATIDPTTGEATFPNSSLGGGPALMRETHYGRLFYGGNTNWVTFGRNSGPYEDASSAVEYGNQAKPTIDTRNMGFFVPAGDKLRTFRGYVNSMADPSWTVDFQLLFVTGSFAGEPFLFGQNSLTSDIVGTVTGHTLANTTWTNFSVDLAGYAAPADGMLIPAIRRSSATGGPANLLYNFVLDTELAAAE